MKKLFDEFKGLFSQMSPEDEHKFMGVYLLPGINTKVKEKKKIIII